MYDLFHVIAKFGREVIDRVRVDEANRLKDDKKARQVVKQSRWLLLRNPENLKSEEQCPPGGISGHDAPKTPGRDQCGQVGRLQCGQG